MSGAVASLFALPAFLQTAAGKGVPGNPSRRTRVRPHPEAVPRTTRKPETHG
jgi:hypothetical protein